MPLMPGRVISRRTMLGRNSAARLTASSPSAASQTTSRLASLERTDHTPAGNFMIVHYQDPNRRHVRSFRLLQLDKIFSRNQLPNQVQARVEYGKRYFCDIF